MPKINLFWFRRDLRLQDNAGLYHALKTGLPVLSVFIFDKNILDKLENPSDARITFLHQTLEELKQELIEQGSTLLVHYGKPEEVWSKLLEAYEINAVFTNHDFEPYAIKRDEQIKKLLSDKGISLQTFKDHVIFEKQEVVKDDGLPYTVFSPYKRKWKAKLATKIEKGVNGKNISYYFKAYPNEKYTQHFLKAKGKKLPTLKAMGFAKSNIPIPQKMVAQKIIKNYDQTRDFPGILGTSRLGIHFRFGTISIREKALKAQSLNDTYLNELIWRDFYSMILYHFPHVVDRPFRQKYERIPWRSNQEEFEKWCIGQTGYPIVDAGMRELNATGYMHNRVRMITSGFLTKHLLIDYRLGEAYFAKHLLDFDLASNNGGWQWAAGCGTDAAPYFRIFNPTSQQQKFDKEFKYIKRWVPEYGTETYPAPMVDHKMARVRCLETFKAILSHK